MTRKNPNFSNYHYRAEIETEEGVKKVKYFYTLEDMCKEFHTSTFTIYQMMKYGKEPRNVCLKGVKFFKDIQPVFHLVKNDNICGQIDDIIF